MHKYKQYIPYLTVLAGLWVLLGVIYYYTPYVIDDAYFRDYWDVFFINPGIATFFHGWKDCIYYTFNFDNGRFFNTIGTPILLLPKWMLTAFLCGCSIANIYLIARISDLWKKSFCGFSLIVFLYIFTMPWADNMLTAMFSLNYVAASVPSLFIIFIVLAKKHLKPFAALLLGLFAAWCHESIGGPTALGLIATMLVYSTYRTRTNLFITAGLLIGLFYLIFLVPGTRVRSIDWMFNLRFYRHLIHVPSFIALIILSICSMAIKKWRNQIDKPALWFIYTICIGGFFIWLAWLSGVRLTWMLELASIIGIGIVIRPIISLIPKWISYPATAIALLATFAHLIACIPYAIKYTDEYDTIHRLTEESQNGEVFYDVAMAWDAPLYTLGKVNYNGLGFPSSTMRTIPTALRNFNPELAEEAICEDTQAYVFDNKHIVLEYYPQYSEKDKVEFIINGNQTNTMGILVPFTGADDKKYLYCRPCLVSLRLKWDNISGVVLKRASQDSK